MGDTYLVRKAFRQHFWFVIRGCRHRVGSTYYCGHGKGSYDFTGDPGAAIHYADFKTANAERLMLEKVLQESLDLSRLSDALKLLGEGITIPQANAPAVPAEAKEKPVKPIEPVTEGDLSEVDAASIEV
jgi:hypothetical protein